MTFDNRWTVSIQNGEHHYSGADTFEIAAFNDKDIWWNFSTDAPFKNDKNKDGYRNTDVQGWTTWKDVVAFVATIKELKED
jgi:hypothetical protein